MVCKCCLNKATNKYNEENRDTKKSLLEKGAFKLMSSPKKELYRIRENISDIICVKTLS